jgi:mannose-1-phosphate guanylyltransferase
VSHRTLPTDALLLTAGLGTRLRPLTADRAKPAVPVAGTPLVGRILRWLVEQGIRDLVLNLHHRAETLTRVVGDGAEFGARVRYSWEVPILGSAGGPRRAFALTGADRLWIVNGDTLTDVGLVEMAESHRNAQALVTMAVVPNPDPRRYGGVVVDEDGAVTGFSRRGDATPSWHFVGVQIAEAETFAGLADGAPEESVNAWYPALLRNRPGSIQAFRSDAAFRDIGTVADYLATCLDLAAREEAPLVGRDVRIAPSARIERSVLWDRVEIGDRATLTECVVGDDVHVPPGSTYVRMTIVRIDRAAPAPGARVDGDLVVKPLDGPRP